jgi:ribosome maturation factor RimP
VLDTPEFCNRGRAGVARAEQLEAVRPIAERVVRSHGFDLFDLQLRREAVGWVLRVVIDLPMRRNDEGAVVVETVDEGVGIDDCQRVSQDLGTVLDVEDAVDRQYVLEVSSPGMDRPLRGADDYRRFAGRLAKIVVTEALDGQMHFEGHIRAVEGDEVVLEVGRGKLKRLPLGRIGRAKLGVEF